MQASEPTLHRMSPADAAAAVLPLAAMMPMARSSAPASSDPRVLAMETPSPASLRMTRDSLLAPHMQPIVNTQSSKHPMLIQLRWKNSPRSCLGAGAEASPRGVLTGRMEPTRRSATIAYRANQTAVPRWLGKADTRTSFMRAARKSPAPATSRAWAREKQWSSASMQTRAKPKPMPKRMPAATAATATPSPHRAMGTAATLAARNPAQRLRRSAKPSAAEIVRRTDVASAEGRAERNTVQNVLASREVEATSRLRSAKMSKRRNRDATARTVMPPRTAGRPCPLRMFTNPKPPSLIRKCLIIS